MRVETERFCAVMGAGVSRAKSALSASGTWEITGPTPPPPGVASKGIYINTLVKQGGKWLIASSAAFPPPPKQ
jgi:hypothetical protein